MICPKSDPSTAVVKERVFNDCPISTLTTVNNYPSLISFTDEHLACSGFANLDVWTLGDAVGHEQAFDNGDNFHIEMDYKMTGKGEGGIRLSPWFSHDADGLFNVRSTDGEIACFGGRLPFYSFSAQQGLLYHEGDPIHLGLTFKRNGLSAAARRNAVAIVLSGTSYTSGPLNLDLGNASEDPPHGLWGILNDARIGGHMKAFMTPGDFSATTHGEFTNIQFSSGTTAGLAVSPGSLNLKSNGDFVTAKLTPSAGFSASDFDKPRRMRMVWRSGAEAPLDRPRRAGRPSSAARLQDAIQNDNGVVTVTGRCRGRLLHREHVSEEVRGERSGRRQA